MRCGTAALKLAGMGKSGQSMTGKSIGLKIESQLRGNAECSIVLLELGFDSFGDFLVANQALHLLDDLAVAGDEEAGGIAEQAAEFVRDGVAAKDDGVVHREFLAVDVEALFGEERSDGGFAVFIHGHAENGEAFGVVLLVHLDEPGNLDEARLTPRGPEIDQNDFPFVLSEGDVLAVQILEGDVGGGSAGVGVGLNGVVCGDLCFDARGLVREISGAHEYEHSGDDQKNFFHFCLPEWVRRAPLE